MRLVNPGVIVIIFITQLIAFTGSSYAQDKSIYNSNQGIGLKGYDVVSYFNKKPVKGKELYSYNYDGIIYRFSSESNKNTFISDPEKYLPQYGGWCAYAMGKKGEKVDIDPETYEIRDGKLYLFYNKFFNNTLDSWNKEGPDKLKMKADSNWIKFKSN